MTSQRPDKKFPLIELFGPTIQGEGVMCGNVTHFIRFGVCDFKCTMCDSKNAVDPEQIKKNARYLPAADIISEISQLPQAPWMTVTGGNPCVHNLTDVVDGIHALGMKVAIETQGTFKPAWIEKCDLITISPKGPGMGEIFNESLYEPWAEFIETSLYMKKEQPSTFFPETCLKVVVFDEEDFEFAKMIWSLTPNAPLYLSLGNSWLPEDQLPEGERHIDLLMKRYKNLAEKLYAAPVLNKAKCVPQLHTLVWSNDKGR